MKNIILLIGGIFFLSIISVAYAGNIAGCSNLDTANTIYTLTANIDNDAGTCMEIQADNVTLDCQGYTIDGVQGNNNFGIIGDDAGINKFNNITIRGCKIKEFDTGIYLGGISNATVSNSTIYSNSNYGIFSIAYGGTSYNTSIYNVTIYNNSIGIGFSTSNNSIIFNNTIYNNSKGIDFLKAYNSIIYNNFLNNTINIIFSSSPPTQPLKNYNYFNTTNAAGNRIYSTGTNIGGNYYTHPNNTGYSDLCQDKNNDKFCDHPFNLTNSKGCDDSTCYANSTDYLPLSNGWTNPFTFISESHTQNILENTETTFTVSMTITSNATNFGTVIGKLGYNNLNYTATSSNIGTTYTFTRTLTTPDVTGNTSEYFTWYFDYLGIEGLTLETNTSNYTQYVYQPNISSCNGGLTKSLIINLKNETTPFADINGTVNAYLYFTYGGNTIYSNFTFTNNTYDVCMYPSFLNQSVYGQIQYTGNVSGEYSNRDYNLDAYQMDNVTDTLNLYLLPDSISSRITITVKDQYSTPQSGVVVKIERWYPELGAYKIVAVPKTDSNGVTNTYLVAYDVDYAFVLQKNGVVLDEINKQKISSADLTLTIAPTPIIEWPYYWNFISGNAIYDDVTGTITGTYSDSSGYLTGAYMTAYKIGALEKTKLCEMYNSSHPTGSFVCTSGNISSGIVTVVIIANLTNGNYHTIYSNIFNEEYYVSKLFGSCKDPLNMTNCKEGVFIAMFLVLVAVLIGIWSPIISILFMLVTLGITIQTGLYSLSSMTFITIVCMTLIFLWRMKA